LQKQLYQHFLSSKEMRALVNGKQTRVLDSIMALRKLVNHPKLILDAITSGSGQGAPGFDGCESLFPMTDATGRGGRIKHGTYPHWSGKMTVLDSLLREMRAHTDDRIVVVSNFTQTLDLIQKLCSENNYPTIRLDGTISGKNRQKLVNQFCDRNRDEFVFLLSSKAGGCGLNLIGGNRLILFDPDWNPATDKQAAARVWRQGQPKRCFVYRFLAAGTIEEKIFQRQVFPSSSC
jgi:DNA repair and recombination RAD54-like protein